MNNKKEHWENVFSTRSPDEVSWTQAFPKTAIDYLENLNLPKSAHIIDIGGGESNFVDAVLDLGYTNISILDISAAALEKAKIRLGEKANQVNWVVSDITEFETDIQFDFWYDRAVFHFLTDEISIDKYKKIVSKSIAKNGHFLLGTFSENGPLKCSGLEITQYSESKMIETFAPNFKPLKCFTEIHTTPFNTTQDFQFCGFTKNK